MRLYQSRLFNRWRYVPHFPPTGASTQHFWQSVMYERKGWTAFPKTLVPLQHNCSAPFQMRDLSLLDRFVVVLKHTSFHPPPCWGWNDGAPGPLRGQYQFHAHTGNFPVCRGRSPVALHPTLPRASKFSKPFSGWCSLISSLWILGLQLWLMTSTQQSHRYLMN